MKKIRNIVLLDFCSEKNRGDAAMQVGTINLVKKYFPESKYAVITVFGANQQHDLQAEFDHTYEEELFLGGLKPTFYPLKGHNTREFLFEFFNLAGCMVAVYLLIMIRSGLSPGFVLKFTGPAYRDTLMALYAADLVIWNGRNFRPRRNFLLDFYRMFNLVFHPLICILLGKKIACIGLSMWPMKKSLSKSLLRYVLSKCFFISSRERSSFNEIISLLGKQTKTQIHQLPDLSFAAINDQRKNSKTNSGQRSGRIGLTLVDWKSGGRRKRAGYILSIADMIKRLIDNNYQIMLIPQTIKNWESTEKILEEISDNLSDPYRKKINRYTGNTSIWDLMEVYRDQDILVATRLHSAIFSAIVGTPAIAIAYDNGGKWGILESLGLEDFIVPYSQLTSVELMNKIDLMMENMLGLTIGLSENVNEQKARVDQNLSLIREQIYPAPLN